MGTMMEEDDDNLETITIKEMTENKLQEGLSNSLDLGSIVKIRQRGSLFTKDNFTIMGFDKADNNYLIKNAATGEVFMKEKDELLTKITSLDDPRNLKIGESTKLKLDTIGELDEFTSPGSDSDENLFDDWTISAGPASLGPTSLGPVSLGPVSLGKESPEYKPESPEYKPESPDYRPESPIEEKKTRTVINKDEMDLNFLTVPEEEEKTPEVV